ncbi:hypothetical protein EB796_020377 [Bugula neritina]|uniref:Uncharacterized protein n=1 Tax=Bugula neritina TaxID=10212 RepID=A0A7J7J5C8_BUGNE|nr:hypothetical protein EB796_020377 [Bugula neritina]
MSYVKASPLLGDRTLSDSESEKKDRRVTQPVTSGEQVSHESRQEYDVPVASGWLYFSIISCVIGTSFSFGYSMGCVNTPALVNKD